MTRKNKNVIISFNTEEAEKSWISLVENEFERFGDKEEYNLNMLKFFEKLHWIEIESEKDLIFQIRLSKSENANEIDYLLEVLSKKSVISQNNGEYQLQKHIEE